MCTFSQSITMLLINDPCLPRPTLIDLNPIELNYYPFMITLENVMEVVILLIIYLQKYVFKIKQNM